MICLSSKRKDYDDAIKVQFLYDILYYWIRLLNSEICTGNIKKFHQDFFLKLDDYVLGEIVFRIEIRLVQDFSSVYC